MNTELLKAGTMSKDASYGEKTSCVEGVDVVGSNCLDDHSDLPPPRAIPPDYE